MSIDRRMDKQNTVIYTTEDKKKERTINEHKNINESWKQSKKEQS